ncbi:MAG: hypothetical protein ABIT37_02615 [Luteolibacter sp.]
MPSLHELLTSDPRHVLVPRLESSLTTFPARTPNDLIEIFSRYSSIRVFAISQENAEPPRNSLNLEPCFDHPIGQDMPLEFATEDYAGYKNSYDLGDFGVGNCRLILDLNDDLPVYRFFVFYPIEPFQKNPIISHSISALLAGMIESGPEFDYTNALIKGAEQTPLRTRGEAEHSSRPDPGTTEKFTTE